MSTYSRGKNPNSRNGFKKSHKVNVGRRTRREQIICTFCSGEFEGFMYAKRRYCSKQCSNKGTALIREVWNKGKKWSEEARSKMSEAHKTRDPDSYKRAGETNRRNGSSAGDKNYFFGRNMSGANNARWISDRSLLVKSEHKHLDGRYREWMRQVKNRDYWKCQISNGDCSGRVEAHHILRWKEFPDLRYEIKNGITLCHFHHPRKQEDERKLADFFTGIVLAKQKIL